MKIKFTELIIGVVVTVILVLVVILIITTVAAPRPMALKKTVLDTKYIREPASQQST